jgi:hypothetical protein
MFFTNMDDMPLPYPQPREPVEYVTLNNETAKVQNILFFLVTLPMDDLPYGPLQTFSFGCSVSFAQTFSLQDLREWLTPRFFKNQKFAASCKFGRGLQHCSTGPIFDDESKTLHNLWLQHPCDLLPWNGSPLDLEFHHRQYHVDAPYESLCLRFV